MPKLIVSQSLVIGVLLLGASFRTAACKAEAPTPAGSSVSGPATAAPLADDGSYEGLLTLWKEFREFQKPQVIDGVPDYSAAATAKQMRGLKGFQNRLAAIDAAQWPVDMRVDFEVVKAEMNGLEFDHRVIRPWSRMPAFYAVIQMSEPDVPLREGPEIHGVLDIWKLDRPG